MSILGLFVALFSVGMFLVSALVSIVATGAPSYFAGLLYDREALVKHNPMIGALSMCDEDGTICTIAPKTEPLQAIRCETLTDIPAIIAPSYQAESVTIVIPRIIGDHRDSKGRFMPKYKA